MSEVKDAVLELERALALREQAMEERLREAERKIRVAAHTLRDVFLGCEGNGSLGVRLSSADAVVARVKDALVAMDPEATINRPSRVHPSLFDIVRLRDGKILGGYGGPSGASGAAESPGLEPRVPRPGTGDSGRLAHLSEAVILSTSPAVVSQRTCATCGGKGRVMGTRIRWGVRWSVPCPDCREESKDVFRDAHVRGEIVQDLNLLDIAARVVDGMLAEWTTSVGEVVYARELDPGTVLEAEQLDRIIVEAERRLADLRTERAALLKRAAERGARIKMPA